MSRETRLTPDQKRILLVLCEAAEHGNPTRLVSQRHSKHIREDRVGAALVHKGLARKLPCKRFEPTLEGFWRGAALRIESHAPPEGNTTRALTGIWHPGSAIFWQIEDEHFKSVASGVLRTDAWTLTGANRALDRLATRENASEWELQRAASP